MQVVLKNVKVLFPKVYTKNMHVTQGKPKNKYDLTVIMDKESDNHLLLRSAVQKVCKEAFGDKYEARMKVIVNDVKKFAIRDGDVQLNQNTGDPKYPGQVYMVPSNAVQPALRDIDGRTPLTEESGKISTGDICNVIVDIWAQDKEGGMCHAKLRGVQFKEHGEMSDSPLTDDVFEMNDPDLVLGDEDPNKEDIEF